MILGHLRSALHIELDRFFEQIHTLPSVSASAFSQARQKLMPSAFIAIRQQLVDRFYRQSPGLRWGGLRLLAIDGSTVRLDGVGQKCRRHFDPEAENKGRCALARVSTCYDVLNRIPIDATLAPYDVDERSLAIGHLDFASENDLVLMDRGYPCFWMFREMMDRDVKFCVRLSVKKWTAFLGDFTTSAAIEETLTLKPSSKMSRECLDRNLSNQAIELRVIKVVLNTGEIEVLVTNLVDDKQWPADQFPELYHQRWSVEEGYKLDKSRLELERWSGKSLHAVEQDFHGRLLLATISACVANLAEPLVKESTQSRQHTYRVNQTRVLSLVRKHIVSLLLLGRVAEKLRQILPKCAHDPCVVRPERSYPRRKGRAPGSFHMAYKPVS